MSDAERPNSKQPANKVSEAGGMSEASDYGPRKMDTASHGLRSQPAADQLSAEDSFPPLPAAGQLQTSHQDKKVTAAETNAPSRGGLHYSSRIMQSPFITGVFQSSDGESLQATKTSATTTRQPSFPMKSFDYKEFYRTGSWVENRSAAVARSSSAGPKSGDKTVNAATLAGGYQGRVAGSSGGTEKDTSGSGHTQSSDRRTTVGSDAPSVSLSGFKPASHHEPCRHTYVLPLPC